MEEPSQQLISFMKDNSSAVFAMLGALMSAGVSFGSAWFLRRQDHSLRLWEKIAERRIQAHEYLLDQSMAMRVMTALPAADEKGEVIRFPNVMMSKDTFETFFSKFATGFLTASTWYTTEVTREANFVQDYLVTLHQTLRQVPTELYPNVGLIIRQDFIDLSSSLERKVSSFFAEDIRALRVGRHGQWHKYKRTQTERRLNATILLINQAEIATLSHPLMTFPLLAQTSSGSGW
ncbi:hypothetical protein I6F11_17375 [Ensifer sp. NBAIM29]|nr:hypothetical protein [Ensifer sp. NBAIM29]